jgi:hypothetical protein
MQQPDRGGRAMFCLNVVDYHCFDFDSSHFATCGGYYQVRQELAGDVFEEEGANLASLEAEIAVLDHSLEKDKDSLEKET